MASAVDETFPRDGVKVPKEDMRAQLLIIKNEISALQTKTEMPWLIATGVLSV